MGNLVIQRKAHMENGAEQRADFLLPFLSLSHHFPRLRNAREDDDALALGIINLCFTFVEADLPAA